MQYLIPTILVLGLIFTALFFSATISTLFAITKKHSERFFWIFFIALLGAIPVITDLRATRGGLDEDIPTGGWTPPSYISFLSEWIVKGVIYTILAYAIVHIALALKSRDAQRKPGIKLYFSYLALVTPIFISAIAGTQPYFSQFLLFGPLIFTLAYLKHPNDDWTWYALLFKRVLFSYVVLSALSGVLAPSITTSPALTLIPGFNFRLNGVFSHSNTLAMAALGYLIFDFSISRNRRYYDHFSTFLAGLVLVLTQSKTTIGCGLLCALIFFIAYRTANARRFISLRLLATIFLLTPALLGIAYVLSQNTHILISHFDNQTYKSLSTLTGRTNIWAITLQSWEENILFGYGPSLWSVEYRLKYAPQYALIVGMAHNQLIQTLGESGLVGALGLLIYCITLLFYGFKFFTITKGGSLAFVLTFLIRGISETPFRNTTIDVVFVMHLAFFIIFLSLINAHKVSKSPLSCSQSIR
ncbi:O-antigen ligase family protein [Rhodoferax mekongensis]|uniref:O-antigen ligase family protein n=1 Tax=Rhodoferax mekongensis TaxID=3068341 RepID=UPI0028BE01F9|nr:O-antigen ligase family protein [Rhodoferax sp. TBRC 17199]MDT7516456.1 O-antigen ligase family protein [Rhodoferax sp. TBRC 17199]